MSTFDTSFTISNLAEHACSIAGFPRLFALGVDGRQIGGAAQRGSLPLEGGRER